MSNLLKFGFLGGGKIAQAMAKGFIASGLTKGENLIASCHPDDKSSLAAFQSLGAKSITQNVPVVEKSDVLFLAVKPNVVSTVLSEVSHVSSSKLFVSIAMGVTTSYMEQILPSDSRVVRVMPNTPMLVQCGASVIARGKKATHDDVQLVETLFKSIGICEEVDEYLMDPITALSGSGPAYIFVCIEALADGGVKMGLPRDLAYRLAAQTVMGAGKMVIDTKRHPAALKDDVTSPAGSTASGLHELEKSGFRNALIRAVEAATKRCKEISGASK